MLLFLSFDNAFSLQSTIITLLAHIIFQFFSHVSFPIIFFMYFIFGSLMPVLWNRFTILTFLHQFTIQFIFYFAFFSALTTLTKSRQIFLAVIAPVITSFNHIISQRFFHVGGLSASYYLFKIDTQSFYLELLSWWNDKSITWKFIIYLLVILHAS